MKNISTLILMLTLICHSQFYCQTNSKGLSLKISDVKTVEKNGKTCWTAKTILNNHSRDTLFYFSFTDCELAFYMINAEVDSISLSLDYSCGVATQTVIAIPPKGQRIVNIDFGSARPMTSSFKLKFYLSIDKAKNMAERIPHDMLVRKRDKLRHVLLISNWFKVITTADKSRSL